LALFQALMWVACRSQAEAPTAGVGTPSPLRRDLTSYGPSVETARSDVLKQIHGVV
jgi:hypothetical protein